MLEEKKIVWIAYEPSVGKISLIPVVHTGIGIWNIFPFELFHNLNLKWHKNLAACTAKWCLDSDP